MRPEERDAAYLWDMLESARMIHDFTSGVSFNYYLQDKKLQLAIERLLEIIGEAAKCVSESFRQSHTEIPWKSIIGQRNVIAHEYGEIKQERLWAVVENHIPQLITTIEPLVPPPPKYSD